MQIATAQKEKRCKKLHLKNDQSEILYLQWCDGTILSPSIAKSFLDVRDFPGGQAVRSLPAMQETQIQPLGWEDPLEKEMVTHSSILA